MYDLCNVSKAAYLHVATKGSNSIKKVLPAVLSTSSHLRDLYSKPIYGAVNGIPSRNDKDFTWWQSDGERVP
jgi:hypothetical protein